MIQTNLMWHYSPAVSASSSDSSSSVKFSSRLSSFCNTLSFIHLSKELQNQSFERSKIRIKSHDT